MTKSKNFTETLKERVIVFNDHVSSVLKTVKIFSNKQPNPHWLDLQISDAVKKDKAYIRRLNYIYNRVIESLGMLRSDEEPGKKKKEFSNFPLNEKELESLYSKYKTEFEEWTRNNQEDYEKFARPFKLFDVVRRLKDDSELGPLLVSSLDSELFTACFIIGCHNSDLFPDERVLLFKRIWHEVSLYVSKQRPYHDLSTLWWGVRVIKDWDTTRLGDNAPKREDKIEVVRKLLDLSPLPKKNGKAIEKILLTKEGEPLKSYDRNGDLVTPRRSLVYCHQNAVDVRVWLEDFRDPQLLPLIKMTREWSDFCANYHWLEIKKKKDSKKKNFKLYNVALDLAFCVNWWKDRLSCWDNARDILKNGVTNIENCSKIKGISTSNNEFAKNLKRAKSTVYKFRRSKNPYKPLVIALFGPPGAGKSRIAKKIGKSSSFIELNLSVHETPKELFTTLSGPLEEGKDKKTGRYKKSYKPILFLDEFDTKLGSEHWYRWLLTLLWDAKFPVVDKPNLVKMTEIPISSVVFLAASRYEKFGDFRKFAFSFEAKNHKAADLITRIDIHLDIPRLKPPDRALIMQEISNGNAKNEVLALCYMAELEDNARGIVKLRKGVNLESEFGLNDLTPAAKESLYDAAGLLGQIK